MSEMTSIFNSAAALKAAIQAILEHPLGYEWTAQGLGMLRLYLPGPENMRLHVWDSFLAVPNVSMIHTHPWNFASYVVAGEVRNTRWTEGEGEAYHKSSIVCGQGGCMFGAAANVRLHPRPAEAWAEGQGYTQWADEIHSSAPEDGTVTLLRRSVPAGRSADQAFVYWPAGEEWVSAEPRAATRDEVMAVVRRSLARWFR
jgi:hypothetical protein